MPRLHYCDTNYNLEPPLDINPLILQLYEGEDLLVICARKGMEIRINHLLETDEMYSKCRVKVKGIWIEDTVATFTRGYLTMFKGIVIVGKTRIYEDYLSILTFIESVCRPTNHIEV